MTLSVTKIVFNHALSLVLGGMSGVRAFLPTFLLAAISLARPDLVELSPTMEWLRHPVSVAVWGVLAAAEIIANLIPAVDNVVHAAMTVVHPVMGFANALAPRLGDAAAWSQGPMAVFGGAQALILHLLKILVRVAGCGCLGPCISVAETFGSLILIPLAIVSGVVAIILAVVVLFAVVAFFARRAAEGADAVAILYGNDPKAQSKLTNYVRRNHSALSVAYLAQDGGMSRQARGALLGVQLTLQLFLATWFLARTTYGPASQDLLVALVLVVAMPVVRWPVRAATGWDVRAGLADRPLGPRALAALLGCEGAAAYYAYGEIRACPAASGGLIAVNFATSVAISMLAFEPVGLAVAHQCCCCCAVGRDDAILEPPASIEAPPAAAPGVPVAVPVV